MPEPLRSRVGDSLWEELLAGAPVVRSAAGTVIGGTESPLQLVVVLSGLVRVFTWAPGGRQVPLGYARPGDLVGLAVLLGGADVESAEAVTDTTLAVISLQRLRTLATRHPQLWWTLAEQVAAWTVASLETLMGAGFQPMSARVARHLLDLAVGTPDGRVIAHVTHRGLADAVGTVREVITRVLGELREHGIVDTSAGRVIVLQPQRLARVAGGEPVSDHSPASGSPGEADLTGRSSLPDRRASSA